MITPAKIILWMLIFGGIMALVNKMINDHNYRVAKEEEEARMAALLDEEIVDDGVLIDMADESHDYGFIVSND